MRRPDTRASVKRRITSWRSHLSRHWQATQLPVATPVRLPPTQDSIHPPQQGLFGHGADHASDKVPLRRHEEGRDAHGLIASSGLLGDVDVHFHHLQPPRSHYRQMLNDRVHHPTRPAPRCPSVNQDWERGLNCDGIEGRVVSFDEPWQRRVTLPTPRRTIFGSGNPVPTPAGWASNLTGYRLTSHASCSRRVCSLHSKTSASKWGNALRTSLKIVARNRPSGVASRRR